jgi:uncharacterized protein YjbJ (UPF0337 family)
MDWDQIQRNWKQAKQTIRRKWTKLTDEDLNAINGQRNRLEDRSFVGKGNHCLAWVFIERS